MFASFIQFFDSPAASAIRSTMPSPVPQNNDTPTIDSSSTFVDSSSSILVQSPEYSSITFISSPDISPIKNNQENGMFETSSSYTSEDSFNSKLDQINFKNTDTQKTVFLFLIDKIRSLETMVIESSKVNDSLRTQLDEKMNEFEESTKSIKSQLETVADKVQSVEFDNHIVDTELRSIQNKLSHVEVFVDDQEKIAVEAIAKSVLEDVVEQALFESKLSYDENFPPLRDHPTPPALTSQDPSCSPICETKSSLSDIQYELGKLRVEFEVEKDLQSSEKDQTNAFLHQLDGKTKSLERKLLKSSQYTRRQNLIIDGIPDHVPQEELERISLGIINKLGFGAPITHYEVEGTHRLIKKNKNSPAPTIIRFTNRKIKEYCIRNRWRLSKLGGPWKLSFRENLETENESIVDSTEE